MIYDTFCFNGEWDLLAIRMRELKSLFDKPIVHIAVESHYTFTGKKKDPSLLLCSNPFSLGKDYNWNTYIPLWPRRFDGPPSDNPWQNEKNLRNHIATVLHGLIGKAVHDPADDDIIIISDIDEIPRKEAILQFKPEMGVAFLDMLKFGFFLNLKEADHWTPPKICSWGHLKNTTPEEVRNAGAPNTINRGGWHFSYCGGIDEVMRKFASFSHQEESVQKHANREELIRKMAVGESLWGNDRWSPVPITELPQYVQDHQEELKHLIFHGNT